MNITEWLARDGVIDIRAEQGLQIQIKENGGVVCVNVDGVCAMRVSVIPGALIDVQDPLRGKHAGYKRVAKRADK